MTKQERWAEVFRRIGEEYARVVLDERDGIESDDDLAEAALDLIFDQRRGILTECEWHGYVMRAAIDDVIAGIR